MDLTKIGIPFGELSRPMQTALFHAKLDGATIEVSKSGSGWYVATHPAWFNSYMYRVKPSKPSIDWTAVHPDYKYLARDGSGRVYLFKEKPELLHVWWGAGYLEAKAFASLDKGTCDWKDSLVKRPEGI